MLVFYTGNDFQNNSRVLNNAPRLPYPIIGEGGPLARDPYGQVQFTPAGAPRPVRAFLREHFQSYRFFAIRLHKIGPLGRLPHHLFGNHAVRHSDLTDQSDAGLYRVTPPPAWQEAINVTLQMIDELNKEVRRSGAVLFVAVIPGSWERTRDGLSTDGPWDVKRPERLLLEFLRSRRVPVLALSERLRNEAARGVELFFPKDGHLTPAGHRVIGEELATALTALRLVPGS